MITVTRINNIPLTVNDDLIESIEETPDTVITFTTGRTVVVKESCDHIVELVKRFRKEIYGVEFLIRDRGLSSQADIL